MQTWIWIFRLLCAALSLLAAILLYRALLHDRSRGRRRCPRCWYDLAGVSGLICPECGKNAHTERSLLRARRHWRHASVALAVAALAYAAGLAPRAIRAGSWWAAVPTPVLVVILQFYDDGDAQLFTNMRARLDGTGAKLSTWERLLLARRCGKILLEPATTLPSPAPTLIAPPLAPVVDEGFHIVELPRSQPPKSPPEKQTGQPSDDELFREAMQAQVRNLLTQADAAFDAQRTKEALDKYAQLHEFHAYLTAEEIEYVDTRLVETRLVLRSAAPSQAGARVMNIGSVLASMGSANQSLQSQALDTLKRLGSDARAALPSLIICIDDPASPYRRSAINIVGSIGPQAGSAAPALVRQLSDTDAIDDVLRALLNLGPAAAAAAPQLRQILRADNSLNRTLDIVRILQHTIPEADLVEDLRQALESDRIRAPTAVARGLELIGKPAAVAIPDLARAARRRPEAMSAAAIQVIASFGPDSVPALTDFLKTGDTYQQFAAACWLGTMRQHAAPATAALIHALGSPDQSVRGQAALALGRIGASSAKPELTRLSNSDPIPWVRETAAEALARLTTPWGPPAPLAHLSPKPSAAAEAMVHLKNP